MAGTFAFREMFRAITRLDWVLRVAQDDGLQLFRTTLEELRAKRTLSSLVCRALPVLSSILYRTGESGAIRRISSPCREQRI